jgi:uncharacterized membrane protein YphA (DoxX/SURF4 family)
MEIVLLIARVILGLYFLMMGMNHFMMMANMVGFARSKNAPAPEITVPFTGLMMIAGALSIGLGLWPVVGLILLIAFLALAAFMMHNFWAITDPQQRMGEMANFTKNLALAAALLAQIPFTSDWTLTL